MKFMLNGAVTIGTDDGANVEIHDLVGDKNIYIFGIDSDTVIEHYAKADYDPQKVLAADPKLQELVDFLVSDQMKEVGDEVCLNRLYQDMTHKDWFMALIDAKDYIETKERAIKDYNDRYDWAKKMLINISKAGYFSSDRTIKQYNEDIWKLK